MIVATDFWQQSHSASGEFQTGFHPEGGESAGIRVHVHPTAPPWQVHCSLAGLTDGPLQLTEEATSQERDYARWKAWQEELWFPVSPPGKNTSSWGPLPMWAFLGTRHHISEWALSIPWPWISFPSPTWNTTVEKQQTCCWSKNGHMGHQWPLSKPPAPLKGTSPSPGHCWPYSNILHVGHRLWLRVFSALGRK